MRSNDNNTSESIPCVQPQCHEFDANVLFNEHGLKPFFGTDRRIKAGDGSQESSFQKYGEKWNVTLTTKIQVSNTPETKPPTELRST